MDYEQLRIKYQSLLEENAALKLEIQTLKHGARPPFDDAGVSNVSPTRLLADNERKIKLFMSLFKGREDVYAKRWENKAGQSGYSPQCLNLWKKGLCQKPNMKCSACPNKNYEPLSEKVIELHLRGKIVAAIYPLYANETCSFLAIDFDEATWEKDVAALRSVCNEIPIPVAVERSRSGNGAHVWVLFEEPVPAVLARKLGTAILTFAMNRRHEISFSSYDRLFPNQDTMPKGGLGNLIALPLQAIPRKNGNSVFVDEFFLPYKDQWEYLALILHEQGE